jgi:tetratricopeptide (TPR) repeat protein
MKKGNIVICNGFVKEKGGPAAPLLDIDRGRPENRGAMSRGFLARFGPLLVAAAAFLVSARALPFELVWDDPILVDDVQRRVARDGLPGLLSAEINLDAGRGTPGYYRPVVLVSLWLDRAVSAAAGLPTFHLTNGLLYAANAALVCLLIAGVTGSAPAALWGGLFFAVHPVHVESVAFVSGRTDLWAALFALLAANAWLADRRRERGSWPLRFAGAAAYLFGLLSKEVVVVLPAVLLFWDFALCGPMGAGAARDRVRGAAARLAPWLLGLGAAVAIRLSLGIAWGVTAASRGGGAASPFASLMPLRVLATYFRLLVLPWPLNAYYTPDQVALGPLTLALAALFLFACLAAGRARDGRIGLLALAWMVAFLLPALGFVRLAAAPVAERFLFLPSAGAALLFGFLVWRFGGAGRARAVVVPAAALALALLAGAFVVRTGVWRDNLTFYTDLRATSPRYPTAPFNLGNRFAALGLEEDAVAAYREAIALEPAYAEAHCNLGIALTKLGRREEAVASLRRALALRPGLTVASLNLAVNLVALGRHQEATVPLHQVLRAEPANAEAHLLLGRAAVARGDRAEAEREYELLRAVDPSRAAQLARELRP